MRFTPTLFNHTEALLSELLRSTFPADLVVSRYFRQHRELGHSERGFIAETVYSVLRRKRSLSARCLDDVTSRRLLLATLACLQGLNRRELDAVLNEVEGKWLAQAKAIKLEDLPPAVRLDLPDWLYEALTAQFDAPQLEALAGGLNLSAPLDLRVNLLKTSRDDVLARFKTDGLPAEPCRYSPIGIRLVGKPSISRHPLFLDGSFEVQDEGSQLLGFLLQPKRGEMVADFCAGAGGKTLLLGALMRSQGRLYAFDVAEKRLAKLKPRLARSGLSNVHPARIESENDIKIKRLAGKLDRVLVDAPCSGLGTLRRNPDLKWRQTPESVAELSVKQAAILHAASGLVKKGGRLVYATCSLLDAENEAVVTPFLAAHPEFVSLPAAEVLRKQEIEIDCDQESGERLRLLPHRHGTDGFFAAVMERR
ncbi:RsmB/NOP family class I SAM-dependent RNA methyltransferase [Propionivibrio sp.]|uniref:RsmB/NOP family class I SAM-dependent RNA methyltransferase n=1 Tax=Propionivibrio sp. TaxID=2212460 RepID=UPI003BF31241